MRRVLAAVGTALLLLGSQSALAAPADEVRALIEQGRAAQAYLLGKQYPDELGKPEFDFYFGVAAVDSGHAGEGVLALERYILLFPENLQARLELARAYFVLGELVRAREEFEAVQKRNPPAGVQANIERFLDAIQAQETRYKTSAGFYFEVGGGYDTNINSGVSDQNVNIAGGVLSVQQTGLKQQAGFLLAGAGAQFSLPFSAGVSLIAGASAEGKWHGGEDIKRDFNQLNTGAYLGTSIISDKDLYRITGSFSQLRLGRDRDRFRDVGALGAEWHRQVDELNTGNLLVQLARLEYPTQEVRNANFFGVGGGWRHSFIHPVRPVLQGQILFAQEKNDAEPTPRDDLTRNLISTRLSVGWTPLPQWSLSSAVMYTRSEYKELDILAGEKRKDNYYGFEFSATRRLTKTVSMRGEYLYSATHSTIDLNDYKRHVVTLKLRYEF